MKTCKKCNATLEKDQKFCTVCGAEAEDVRTEHSHNQSGKKQSKKGTVLAVCIIILLVAGGIVAKVVLLPAIEKSNTYKEAVSCYSDGQYEKAQTLFAQLGDYKDAKQKAVDACVGRAERFIEDEDFDNAREVLASVDSTDTIENTKKKCDYAEAESLVKKEDYQNAYNMFSELAKKDYKDADVMAEKVLPQAAEEAYEKIIEESEKEIMNDSTSQLGYTFFDFEKDGVNELVSTVNGKDLKIYTFKKGNVEKILDANFGWSGCITCYDSSSKILYTTTGGEDHFHSWYYKLSDKFENLGTVVEDYASEKFPYPYEYNGKITKYDSIEKLEKKLGLSSNGEYIDLWQN